MFCYLALVAALCYVGHSAAKISVFWVDLRAIKMQNVLGVAYIGANIY